MLSINPKLEVVKLVIYTKYNEIKRMILVFKNIYRIYKKHVKKRFFIKIFIIFSFIIILSFVLMATIISKNISSVLKNKELEYNSLVLYDLNIYLSQQFDLVYKISQQAYLDNLINPSAYDFMLQTLDNTASNTYYSSKRIFSSYFRNAFSRDKNMTGIIVYKMLESNFCIFSASGIENSADEDSFQKAYMLEQLKEVPARLHISPAGTADYYYTKGSPMVYTISGDIKYLGSNDNLGLLMVDFSTDGIAKHISLYGNVKGDFIVLTQDGDVVFDSSEKYYGNKYPYIGYLTDDTTTVEIDGSKYLINTNISNDFNLIIASIIPERQILSSIAGTERMIFFIALVCILVSMVFFFMSTKSLSKRIESVIDFIKKVRKGNLKLQIEAGKSEDEIGEIANSLNQMCRDLDNYIEKSYISEIRQKNAALAALQAQVNPHFLYNTLESIRMKAVYCGVEEVADMIFLLAKLFRNSIKEENIVTINDEIDFSEIYINLCSHRFGNRFKVLFDIDEQILEYVIPKHTLQPIIENFTVHGFDENKEMNIIKIHAYKDNDDIAIIIEDNGKGIDKDKYIGLMKSLESESNKDLSAAGSIGLSNIHKRIKIIFGEEYGLSILSKSGSGTAVHIKIPTRTKEELAENV